MLNNVVESCFGPNLQPGYCESILCFKQAYLDLDIAVTPKVHAIFFHIVEFCGIVDAGLGKFSEQASESVHYNFKTE